MNKSFSALLFAGLLAAASAACADDWNLVKNVKRLESVAPDYKADKAIDKKFLDVIDLTEKTKKDSELYAEAKRIAAMPTLSQSKYMDSFLYYLLVKSTALSKNGAAEADFWLGQLKTYSGSPHILPAGIIRMKQLPENSPDIRRDAEFLVEWIRAQKPDAKVRAPEYSRSLFMSYKPRSDFADGDFPKLYKLSYYKSSVTPIEGFLEDETYVSLLDKIKAGREDVLTEMAAIYRKMGKRKEASEMLYHLATIKVNAKDFQQAKTLLDDAVKQNPDNAAAVKERNRIKLELTYQSLEPVAPVPPVAPVVPAVPAESAVAPAQ